MPCGSVGVLMIMRFPVKNEVFIMAQLLMIYSSILFRYVHTTSTKYIQHLCTKYMRGIKSQGFLPRLKVQISCTYVNRILGKVIIFMEQKLRFGLVLGWFWAGFGLVSSTEKNLGRLLATF